jgi:hypothetical protein
MRWEGAFGYSTALGHRRREPKNTWPVLEILDSSTGFWKKRGWDLKKGKRKNKMLGVEVGKTLIWFE